VAGDAGAARTKLIPDAAEVTETLPLFTAAFR
jgi:hypothetical protein